MDTNNPSPITLRTGRLGRWQERWQKLRGEWQEHWPEIILRDIGIAAILGVLLFAVSWYSDGVRENHAERVENLRFVRDVATRQSGHMPFRNLNLEGMKLSGLRLPCRDQKNQAVGACFYKPERWPT